MRGFLVKKNSTITIETSLTIEKYFLFESIIFVSLTYILCFVDLCKLSTIFLKYMFYGICFAYRKMVNVKFSYFHLIERVNDCK